MKEEINLNYAFTNAVLYNIINEHYVDFKKIIEKGINNIKDFLEYLWQNLATSLEIDSIDIQNLFIISLNITEKNKILNIEINTNDVNEVYCIVIILYDSYARYFILKNKENININELKENSRIDYGNYEKLTLNEINDTIINILEEY